MNGFIHQLFIQKWRLYGRPLFIARRLLDLVLLVMLLALSFALKSHPEVTGTHTAVVCCMLVTMVVIVTQELGTMVLFAMNEQGEARAGRHTFPHHLLTPCPLHVLVSPPPPSGTSEERLSVLSLCKLTAPWARIHGLPMLMAGHLFTLASCCMLLALDFPASDEPFLAANASDGNASDGNASVAAVRRLLKGGGSDSGGSDAEGEFILVDEGAWFVLWLSLAAAQLLLMTHFITFASTPFESLHILLLSVGKIFVGDISIFVVLYSWVIATGFSVLFTLYPRSGEHTLALLPFNHMGPAFVALVELALVGEPVQIETDFVLSDVWQAMPPLQLISIACIAVSYILFILLSIVLLLNLLIALLTHTFDAVLKESTLQSRLSYARLLIHLELVATALGMRTRVGEKCKDGRYAHRPSFNLV